MTDDEILERINNNIPPCIETIGGKLIEAEQETGKAVLEYEVGAPFCHEGGKTVQGGYIATMLDAAMANAISVKSVFTRGAPTLELKVSYFRPAKAGKFTAEARIIRMGRSVTFAEADLWDADGALVAKATSTIAARERKAQ